jgi:HSP20 family molecular chaperone IbpA|tara:strand:+ start:154 stop:564 length:411 start_codon:yes stop_codon:yes gene_type:complete
MSTLFLERNPFDILVRNFFQDASQYRPLAESKLPHPVDIYHGEEGLGIDIACTGLMKEDIEIIIDGNIIKVNYNKPKDEDPRDFVLKGIAQRSFNLGWKIDSKFELSKAKADFVNGLLRVSIPYAKGMETKTLKIS